MTRPNCARSKRVPCFSKNYNNSANSTGIRVSCHESSPRVEAEWLCLRLRPSVIYTFSFAHHGSYSSFHRLAHYLSDQCVIDLTWRSIDRLPQRISAPLMHRWLK